VVSFRADEDDVAAADQWAAVLGVDRSELLCDAVTGHLVRLAAEEDALAYEREPFTEDEAALDIADDWGPAEDWSDWAAWADRRGK
jgi:hypothetical protein